MTTVSRKTFFQSLARGVDLDRPGLDRALRRAGVTLEQLKTHDRDRDDVLSGAELGGAFRLVDRLDRDGSSRSFSFGGAAGKLYGALLDGRRRGPYFGLAIAKVAISISAFRGEEYAVAAAPTCPNPSIAGNRSPGHTRLAWLAGRYKCNQFVGDALWRAAVSMPTYVMPGGYRHYVNAEALPAYRGHFDRVSRVKDLRVGDVLVIDLPRPGQDGAHAEILTHLDRRTGLIRATGAHADGAYETVVSPLFGKEWTTVLAEATHDGVNHRWSYEQTHIYLLRPKRPR